MIPITGIRAGSDVESANSHLVNQPLLPPPQCSPHLIPPFQSPSVPAFIPNPAAVQICIDAFTAFRQSVDECKKNLRENMQKIQERLQHSRRLIRELSLTVPPAATAATTSYSGPRSAPTLSNPPPYTSDSPH
ncbi:hypothetical protein ACLB2K_014253 [Fragaria x ananassa]